MGAHISILVPKVRQKVLPPLQGLFVFIRTRGCTPVCYPTPLRGFAMSVAFGIAVSLSSFFELLRGTNIHIIYNKQRNFRTKK